MKNKSDQSSLPSLANCQGEEQFHSDINIQAPNALKIDVNFPTGVNPSYVQENCKDLIEGAAEIMKNDSSVDIVEFNVFLIPVLQPVFENNEVRVVPLLVPQTNMKVYRKKID